MHMTPEKLGKLLNDLRKKSGATTAVCYVHAGAKGATVLAIGAGGEFMINLTADTFTRAIAEAHDLAGLKLPQPDVGPSASATFALIDVMQRGVQAFWNAIPDEMRGEELDRRLKEINGAAMAITRIAFAPGADRVSYIEHLENALQKVNDARAALTDLPGVGVTNLRQERIQEALDFLDGAKDILNTLNGETNGEEPITA